MGGLNQLADLIHQDAIAKGWWEEDRNFGELIALMHSELSEALESWRKDEEALFYNALPKGTKIWKPEWWAVELIDALIRILDCLAAHEIDTDSIVEEKMVYNRTREWRHGGLRA